MLEKLITTLKKYKESSQDLNWGRDVILDFVKDYLDESNDKIIKILDLGVGEGYDLENIKNRFGDIEFQMNGIESYEPNVVIARTKGIKVSSANLEADTLPHEDRSMDIVIVNQVLEHTKEFFWIVSEIGRVLKPGGVLIIGVPNLASFHNRLLLLVGRQPSCIQLLSAHIRGFTSRELVNALLVSRIFESPSVKGSNFYPFPPRISKLLSRLFPSFSVSLFVSIKRTQNSGSYIDLLNTYSFETPYYKGPWVKANENSTNQ